MYVDIEIISNNTYTNNLFTYKVPNNVTDKINIGSIISVPFRNKDYKGIVLSLTDKTDILNVKENPRVVKEQEIKEKEKNLSL